MNKPRISIIIPVYNIAEHVQKCLNSLISQTLQNIEIIVVNDASSDNSQQVIDQYCENDTRLRSFINSSNKGPFLSRLEGLKYVNGEYVTFVDGDDHIEPEAYKAMYAKAIEGNYDIVACGINRLEGEIVRQDFLENSIVNKDVLGQDILKNLLLEKISNSLWNKLYRRETINAVLRDDLFVEMRDNLERNGINLLIEDQLFNIFASFFSKSYFMMEEPFYNYIFRENSLCSSKNRAMQHEWSKSAMHNFYILERLLYREDIYDNFHDEIEEMTMRLVVRRKRRVLSLFPPEVRTDSALFDNTIDHLTQYVSGDFLLKHVIEAALLEISQSNHEKRRLLREKKNIDEKLIELRSLGRIKNILSIPRKIGKKFKRKLPGG